MPSRGAPMTRRRALRHCGVVESRSKSFVDFQNDVTSEDVALAAREGYRSVELLKRYTTLGMATDQGRTSNVNGLAIMAALTRARHPRGRHNHIPSSIYPGRDRRHVRRTSRQTLQSNPVHGGSCLGNGARRFLCRGRRLAARAMVRRPQRNRLARNRHARSENGPGQRRRV